MRERHNQALDFRTKEGKEVLRLNIENARLRSALRAITEVKAYDQPSAVQGWEERGRIAREALNDE